MRFRVWISEAIDPVVDEHLSHEAASRLFNEVILDLRDHSEVYRDQRHESDPEVFYYRWQCVEAGRLHTFDFVVCDGWEPDRLHVLRVHYSASDPPQA